MAKLPTTEDTPKPEAVAPSVPQPPRRRVDAEAAAVMAVPKATGPAPGVPAPTGPVQAPFWFCIHPLRWRVLEGAVVPDPKTLHGTFGANGVDRNPDGTPNMRHAFDMQAHNGWTVLPHDVAGPGTSYLKQVQATGGWITLWTKVYPGSSNSSHDGKAESVWWVKLIASGAIDPVPMHVLTTMRATNVRLLNRYVDRGRAADGARVKRVEQVIAAIDAELAKFSEAA